MVARILQDLVRQGFSHDDIVILTCHGAQNSVFRTLDAVGGVELRRFTGEYTPAGDQVLSEGRITFDSVYRFKGQEAAAVVLVDTDAMAGSRPDPDRIARAQRVLYVGITRATVRLDMTTTSVTSNALPKTQFPISCEQGNCQRRPLMRSQAHGIRCSSDHEPHLQQFLQTPCHQSETYTVHQD